MLRSGSGARAGVSVRRSALSSTLRGVVGIAALAAATSLSGCRATDPTNAASPANASGSIGSDPAITASVVPADLTVDITVLRGRGVEPIDRIEYRTGRYILFPEGSLHADAGPTLRADVRPGVTRHLGDAEMIAVWRSLQETGLAEFERFEPPTNDAVLLPPRGIIAHLVTIVANGERWQVIRALPPASVPESDTTPLVRLLAGLAWERDALPESMLPGGIRYDFGPDPHAAFRDVGTVPEIRRRSGAARR